MQIKLIINDIEEEEDLIIVSLGREKERSLILILFILKIHLQRFHHG
jgi:hypothetical protein